MIMETKKIVIVCPTSRNIVNFRKNLIIKLQSCGYTVSAIVFDDKCKDEIIDLGVAPYFINDNNRSINPFKLLSIEKKYKKIIKSIAPDIVFTFMLKPNIYATRAAKKSGIKHILSMVEGAGDVFGNNGFIWRIIRSYCCYGYKLGFKSSDKVFFTNKDDKEEFVSRGIVDLHKTEVVHGIGVDVEHFAYKPIKNYNIFLMVSRLMKPKGVFDYCDAARIVKAKYPEAVFNLIGGESTLKQKDIQKYIDDGTINYLGKKSDVRPYYEECTVQVLPTYYREGLGLVNAEAGAIGRATITCDVVGARDTVEDGYNGLFVIPKNPQDLADKMIWFLQNPNKADELGKNNHKFAEDKFDQRKINQYIVNLIENLMENT